MKIFKGQYGWSTSAHSTNKNGEKIRCFLDCQFKRGEEPIGEDVEGTLIFRGMDGQERECFFSSYVKQGVAMPKLVLMRKAKNKQQTLTGDGRDLTGHLDKSYDPAVEINPDELPFF